MPSSESGFVVLDLVWIWNKSEYVSWVCTGSFSQMLFSQQCPCINLFLQCMNIYVTIVFVSNSVLHYLYMNVYVLAYVFCSAISFAGSPEILVSSACADIEEFSDSSSALSFLLIYILFPVCTGIILYPPRPVLPDFVFSLGSPYFYVPIEISFSKPNICPKPSL